MSIVKTKLNCNSYLSSSVKNPGPTCDNVPFRETAPILALYSASILAQAAQPNEAPFFADPGAASLVSSWKIPNLGTIISLSILQKGKLHYRCRQKLIKI
jgi:hypothetical protein